MVSRYWLLILVVSLVFAGVGLYVAYSEPVEYESNAHLAIGELLLEGKTVFIEEPLRLQDRLRAAYSVRKTARVTDGSSSAYLKTVTVRMLDRKQPSGLLVLSARARTSEGAQLFLQDVTASIVAEHVGLAQQFQRYNDEVGAKLDEERRALEGYADKLEITAMDEQATRTELDTQILVGRAELARLLRDNALEQLSFDSGLERVKLLGDTRIVKEPGLPENPVRRRIMSTVIAVSTVGFLVGLLLAWFFHQAVDRRQTTSGPD